MNLFLKIFSSSLITCCFAKNILPMEDLPPAIENRPTEITRLDDPVLCLIFEKTLTAAANEDPTLTKFAETAENIAHTCKRFRNILFSVSGKIILKRALNASSINEERALFNIVTGTKTWLISLIKEMGFDVNTRNIKAGIYKKRS